MDKFDINKPYTTRDGRKAQVVTGPDGLLYGWAEAVPPGVLSKVWKHNGEFDECPHPLDLINVPEKRTVKGWLNVYDDHHGMDLSMVHPSKAQADLHSSSFRKRIACIEREITYTVGEGL